MCLLCKGVRKPGEHPHWICDKHFLYVPVELRHRYWKETNFGEHKPSEELLGLFRRANGGK